MRLKALREEIKLSQLELADKLNMSQQAISAYENNKREPDIETIKKLADFFNVSTDYLLGKTDNRNSTPLTEEEMGFVSQVKELEPAQKDFLKSVMKTLKEQKNKDK